MDEERFSHHVADPQNHWTGAVLDGIRLGEVRLVRCADVAVARDQLRIESEQRTGGPRVVLCSWTELCETAVVLEHSIDALARTALALWPRWYGLQPEASDAFRQYSPSLLAADALPSGVSPAWLQRAADRCRRGQTPRLPKFAAAIEAAQLALAIEPQRLYLVLAQTASTAAVDCLLPFARASEWLAKETRARVVVLVSTELAASSALDSINFNAVDFPVSVSSAAASVTGAGAGEEKQSLLVWPFHGNPHPDSPGEQLLAKRLARDAELAGLFAFNQPIQSVRGSTFTVDLLWKAGRVVVEVDGYGWHSGVMAFGQDRQRDYELVISGYLVLRLTHEEIIDDAALAVEKIRDVVAYRRRETSGKGDY